MSGRRAWSAIVAFGAAVGFCACDGANDQRIASASPCPAFSQDDASATTNAGESDATFDSTSDARSGAPDVPPDGVTDSPAPACTVMPTTTSLAATNDILLAKRGPSTTGAVVVSSGRVVAPIDFDFALAVYDPPTNTWSYPPSPPGVPAEEGPFALVALDHDLVLAVGAHGCHPYGCVYDSYAAIFDVAASTWTRVPDFPSTSDVPRMGVRVTDGRVIFPLTIGGSMIFDPVARTWSAWSDVPSLEEPSITLLPDGNVLLAGGRDPTTNAFLSSVWKLDVAMKSVRSVAPMHDARARHYAARLLDGRILIAGGERSTDIYNPASWVETTEIYDPAHDVWTYGAPLPGARNEGAIAVLGCGGVVIAGGYEDPSVSHEPTLLVPTTSVYVSTPTVDHWTKLSMQTARFGNGAVTLTDGSVMIFGGADTYEAGTSAESIR